MAHPLPLSGNTSNSSKHHTRRTKPDGFAVRALDPALKGEVCRATDQLSTKLVRRYGAIFVGNVNASALTKTGQAKSVLDAGWSQFRSYLQYKCDDAGGWFVEVNEAYSTQDCSVCDARSGPKGLKELGIREWVCSHCGTVHQRDRNAAKNILRRGRATLAVGIPVLSA